MAIYTSVTSPLRISEVSIPLVKGRVGLTICPGKCGASAKEHVWDRDLNADLSVVSSWPAKSVVSLLESQEFQLLRVDTLGDAIKKRGIDWYHFDIVDGGTPDKRFLEQWSLVHPVLVQQLREGRNVLVHCRGGLGRSGMIGSLLLIDVGVDGDRAIDMIREARPGAIETTEQEAFVREYASRKPAAENGNS